MEPVRTGLRQMMSDLLRARPAEEAVLLAWPLVCGKEVAARSQAAGFNDGCLIVEVADAGWQRQLQSFAPRYLSQYEGLLGPLVRSVEFKLQHSASSTEPLAKAVRSASNNRPLSSAQKRLQSNKRNKG